MKQLLTAYYESDVIPSIVLACLCGLGWYAGDGYVAISKVLLAFLFFLGAMAVERVWKVLKELWDVLI